MITLHIDMTPWELKAAAKAIERRGLEFDRWVESLIPDKVGSWSLGVLFGAIIQAASIVSPESGPSSKTH